MQGGLAGRVVDAPERRDAGAVDEQRRDLLLRGADDRELGRDLAAQRLEGAQQHRQALALDGLADEDDPQRLARGAPAGLDPLRQDDAVGDDPVVAAVEAPAGPGGGLGDRDPHVEPVELAAGAEQGGDVVRRARLRVAVEGADERRVGARERVPSDDRGHRLVHVHDVGREGPQLAPDRGDGRRRRRQVGDGAVQRPADRPAERHQPVGPAFAHLWPRAAMPQRGGPRVVVVGGEDANLVPAGHQLAGERLDVTRDAARIRPRVRGDEGCPHRLDPTDDPGLPGFG